MNKLVFLAILLFSNTFATTRSELESFSLKIDEFVQDLGNMEIRLREAYDNMFKQMKGEDLENMDKRELWMFIIELQDKVMEVQAPFHYAENELEELLEKAENEKEDAELQKLADEVEEKFEAYSKDFWKILGEVNKELDEVEF